MIDRPPRVLHLFANYKWTGPADPAIRGAVWQRRLGADVRFALAQWTLPGAEHRMAKELWNARLPVVTGLELRKHFRIVTTLGDTRRLAERLRRERFDAIHCHLLGDHLVAALALRRLGQERPVLVRSLYDPDPPSRGWRERLVFAATDGVIAPTARCARGVIERFRIGADRVLVQDPPTETFRCAAGGDLRERLGIGADDFAIGITARIQPHRRFDLLWEVAARVVARRPKARFVLLGRGNEKDTQRLVTAPVQRLGLAAHAVLPGYLHEPEYTLALRSLDAFVFLVPGSDGTCRAVREAMALGLPIVATRRGMLPDLLGGHPDLADAGPAGRLVDEEPAAIADALVAMCDDEALRERLGAAARARVEGPMDPCRAAQRTLQLYAALRRREASS